MVSIPSFLRLGGLILVGYDGSLMGSINAIPEYQDYYHLGSDGAASTGLVFSIFQIGQMVGALFIWICDWQGRKLPIFGGCLGVVISTVITAEAPNRELTIDASKSLSNRPSCYIHRGPLLTFILLHNRNCGGGTLPSRNRAAPISRNRCWQ